MSIETLLEAAKYLELQAQHQQQRARGKFYILLVVNLVPFICTAVFTSWPLYFWIENEKSCEKRHPGSWFDLYSFRWCSWIWFVYFTDFFVLSLNMKRALILLQCHRINKTRCVIKSTVSWSHKLLGSVAASSALNKCFVKDIYNPRIETWRDKGGGAGNAERPSL